MRTGKTGLCAFIFRVIDLSDKERKDRFVLLFSPFTTLVLRLGVLRVNDLSYEEW